MQFHIALGKGFLYIYVFTSASDQDAVRAERDRLRAIQKYEFPNALVLTVVKAGEE